MSFSRIFVVLKILEGGLTIRAHDTDYIRSLVAQLEMLRAHLCDLVNRKGTFVADKDILKISSDFDRLASRIMKRSSNP